MTALVVIAGMTGPAWILGGERNRSRQLAVRDYEGVLTGRESYDGVIVDVPCSNLGVLRCRADAMLKIEEKDLYLLAEIQFHLMEKGEELVRPGGVLVYSTCTFTSSLEARR